MHTHTHTHLAHTHTHAHILQDPLPNNKEWKAQALLDFTQSVRCYKQVSLVSLSNPDFISSPNPSFNSSFPPSLPLPFPLPCIASSLLSLTPTSRLTPLRV